MILDESKVSQYDSYLTCDECSSSDIIESNQSFVCRSCGTVLEIQIFQYNRPYNDDIIQYANGLGRTQIGTKGERSTSSHSEELNRLHKQNSVELHDEIILRKAHTEISKLFTNLKLQEFHYTKKMVYKEFKRIYEKLRTSSKYRNVPKLVAIITYLYLKINIILINPPEIIETIDIKRKEFNDFFLQVRQYLPQYASRDRQKYIIKRILEVTEHFEFGMPFYYQTRKIFSKLWDVIKNTSDNIIVGLVCSISNLCIYDHKIPVTAICNKLDIAQGTINTQMKNKIFTYLKIKGFTGLVKSAGLLLKVLEKWGIIEVKNGESQEKIELVFGIATDIFSHNDDIDYYFFALPYEKNNLTVLFVKIYHPLMNFAKKVRSKNVSQQFIEFKVVKYRKGKDPPIKSP